VATRSNSGLSSLSNLAQTWRPASVMLIIAKRFERASARVHGFRHRLRQTRPELLLESIAFGMTVLTWIATDIRSAESKI
jgi:hypothetical protein